jgi:hypothetical protein
VLASQAKGGAIVNKTSESIERQESRKEDEKKANLPRFHSQNSVPVSVEARDEARRRQLAGLKPWPKGVSGNPGGRPKVDVAAEIARALFEQDRQAIFEAFRKVLRKGSPYAFQVLSDRAFGKLKETHAIEHNPYKHLSDEELEAKIKDLEQRLAKDLGYVKAEPQILPPAKDDPKVQ